MNACLMLACIVVGPPPAADPGRLPQALRDALVHRTSLVTAHIEYERTHKYKDFPFVGAVRFEQRAAGEDLLQLNHGDRDGIRARGMDGEPMWGVGFACTTDKEFWSRSSERHWQYSDRHYEAGVSSLDKPGLTATTDMRLLGITIGVPPDQTPQSHLEQWIERTKYFTFKETKREDGSVRVVADSTRPEGRRVEWLIDPSRDFAVLRSTVHWKKKGGGMELLAESEAEYALFDGVWFPRRYVNRHARSRETEEIVVKRATFNRPDHPNPLTPADMGLPVGLFLNSSELWGVGPQHARRWEGTSIVTREDWELIKGGYDTAELDEIYRLFRERGCTGEYPQWWYAERGDMGIERLAVRPDEWETYVRRWIFKNTVGAKHPLGEEQKESALAILKELRGRAYRLHGRYVNRPDPARTATEAKPESAVKDRPVKPEALTAEKRKELDERIGKLFERLKQRLDRLLRLEQPGTSAKP